MSHYAFNWFALPPIITSLCSLAVGLRVLLREWTSRVAESMFAGTAAIAVWLGGVGLMYLATDPPTAYFWARVVYVAVPVLPAAIYLYVAVGLRRYQSERLFILALALVALALVVLANTSHLLISGVEKQWWGYYPTYGPAGSLLVGYFAVVIVLGFTKLRARLLESPRGSVFHRRIALSCLAGVFVCLASVDFLTEFGVPVYPFGYVAVLAFLTVVALVERRHRIVYMTPAAAAGQILATMQGAILVTTPAGKVEVGNHAAGELLGYSDAELLELSLGDVFGSESEWSDLLHRCLAEENARDHETRWRSKSGGALDVSVSASLLADAKKRPVGVVFAAIDITGRKRAEEALRESEEQLRQAQKMEAVGQLAGGIAHDFNNLLTAIIGNSALALTTMDPTDPHRELMVDIKDVGERAAALTRQILAFSRRQMLRPEVVCLNQVILELEPLLRLSLRENIELRFLLAPDLKVSEMDPHQIGQVLLNLAANARDAMPEGGRLVIETANTSLDENHRHTHGETKAGDYVMLAVSDDGCGMDSRTREHLFEPFFTTKEIGKGTGLGLPTAFGIVVQSRGAISVCSEVGEGSTFKVYLPMAETPVVRAADPAPESRESGRSCEHVLVVEDEAPVRAMVVRVLSRTGYQVRAAGSFQETETLLETTEYRPDLLLTDIVLPGAMNGSQVSQALLTRFPKIRVVFMSGYARDAVTHDKLVDDGVAFLEKPFTPDMLLRKVREVLDAEATDPAAVFGRR